MTTNVLRHPAFWMANIWLTFLLFPMTSLLTGDTGTSTTRVVGAVLMGVFALVHALGYAALVRREIGVREQRGEPEVQRWLDPRGPVLWFCGLILVTVAILLVAGWSGLGVFPFIVSYAVFNFSWRTAIIVITLTLLATVVPPAVARVLDHLWFVPIIVAGVAGASALVRATEENQAEYNTLQAQLKISEERARVARDVHDVLGHSLTAIILKTQVIERLLAQPENGSPSVQQAREQLDEMDAVSRGALAEIRTTVTGLRSSSLENELAAARAVLDDAGIQHTVRGDIAQVPHPQVLGWVIRETVTNVVRHSRATNCEITLSPTDTVLSVSDDGQGRRGRPDGNGLRGLQERLAEVDLHLRVDESNGTRVCVTTQGDRP